MEKQVWDYFVLYGSTYFSLYEAERFLKSVSDLKHVCINAILITTCLWHTDTLKQGEGEGREVNPGKFTTGGGIQKNRQGRIHN